MADIPADLKHNTDAALSWLTALSREAWKYEPEDRLLRIHARKAYKLVSEIAYELEAEPRPFDVRSRIIAMREDPEAWARTKESFITQLALLLDVGGLVVAVKGIDDIEVSLNYDDQQLHLTPSWGRIVADKARALYDRHHQGQYAPPSPPSPPPATDDEVAGESAR